MTTYSCPRCQVPVKKLHTRGLSRHDNQTLICEECVTREALEYAGLKPDYNGKPYWKEQ